mgnify:CR=1 FL=1
MRSIVKISWAGSTPELKLADSGGYETITLSEGRELNLEVIDERRCVGYHASKGNMAPCPEFRKISSGDQCAECRGKDIYTDFRRGNSGEGLEDDYSVYMVQIGEKLKVGVTRSERLENRWLEQGAVLAAVIEDGLSAGEALDMEQKISGKGVSERIRKEDKNGFNEELLQEKLEELGIKSEIRTISEPLKCTKIVRKGRIPSPIEQVNGQIISNGKIGLAMTSGRCLTRARQKGLQDF